jgi:hypothetical protein
MTPQQLERAAERAAQAHGKAEGRAICALASLPPGERRRWLDVARAVLEQPAAGIDDQPSVTASSPRSVFAPSTTYEHARQRRAGEDE